MARSPTLFSWKLSPARKLPGSGSARRRRAPCRASSRSRPAGSSRSAIRSRACRSRMRWRARSRSRSARHARRASAPRGSGRARARRSARPARRRRRGWCGKASGRKSIASVSVAGRRSGRRPFRGDPRRLALAPRHPAPGWRRDPSAARRAEPRPASPRPPRRCRGSRGGRSRNSADRHLVRRIQYGGCPAARPQGLARQAQRGEAHRVGRRRSRAVPSADEVEPRHRGRHALRPGQRMGDRRAHVRRAELGQHRAVRILHQAVDDRLRVDQHLDPVFAAARTGARASISSRPLFIMVARIDEILAPIDQFGCATACSGVTRAICVHAARSRNGPPEAVRMMRSIAVGGVAGRRAPGRWRCARNRPAAASRPAARGGRQHDVAGADQAFLVGERHHAAARAGRPASAPGRPRRRWRPSSSRPGGRGLDHRVGPGRDLDAGPGQRVACSAA